MCKNPAATAGFVYKNHTPHISSHFQYSIENSQTCKHTLPPARGWTDAIYFMNELKWHSHAKHHQHKNEAIANSTLTSVSTAVSHIEHSAAVASKPDLIHTLPRAPNMVIGFNSAAISQHYRAFDVRIQVFDKI